VRIRTTSGTVSTAGGGSIGHDFTRKLDLGIELVGAVSHHNFDLGREQLQSEIGGNYQLYRNLTLDLGLIGDFYQASPRVGSIIGFSVDF
jgi:hypothetical protein